MDYEIFKAGVRPGGPTSIEEIKMLICYILSKLDLSMSFSQLHETFDESGLVNYFELVRAVEGLKKTGHLSVEEADGAEQYAVTSLGIQTAEVFESSLPPAVRDRAVQTAYALIRRQRREQEVRITQKPTVGGFLLELSIPDHGSYLSSFSLFVPTEEECERMKRNFLNDPLFIYRGVVALLAGDEKAVGDIFPRRDRLY